MASIKGTWQEGDVVGKKWAHRLVQTSVALSALSQIRGLEAHNLICAGR